MSSSYRRRSARAARGLRRAGVLGGAALVLGVFGSPAAALQYFVPRVEATGEWDSNINMDPTQRSKAYGYGGIAMADIGWVTPTSDTAFRPYFNYIRYPDQFGIYQLDSRLDFRSYFNTARGQFSIYGRFDREDTTYAELSSALYNPLDPNVRPNADTGYIREGVIRTLFYVAPSYQYRLTPRLAIDADAYYLKEHFSDTGQSSSLSNFNYYQLNLNLAQRVSETSVFKYGPYFSRFDSGGVATADGYGLKLEYDHKWSQTISTQLSANGERDKTDQTYPIAFSGTTTQWGAVASVVYEGQISTTRFTIDRILSPSGAGVKTATNDAWLQYDRHVTERLRFIGAIRYIHDGAVGQGAEIFPVRNYARTNVEARWMMTPTWYFRAYYEYTWQKFHAQGSAANNSVSIGFGYQALKPKGVP